MNVFSLLKEDHKKVLSLLEEAEQTTNRAKVTREKLFEQIKQELQIHTQMEEQFLYPLLKEKKEAHDLTMEAYEEHHVVDNLLNELQEVSPEQDEWEAKITVLRENVQHHVKEEEGEMFKMMHNLFEKSELETMLDQMQDFKMQQQAAVE